MAEYEPRHGARPNSNYLSGGNREAYHGRHRAEDVVNLGKYRRLEKYGLESAERPPSPTYRFTLVEQPGGEH